MSGQHTPSCKIIPKNRKESLCEGMFVPWKSIVFLSAESGAGQTQQGQEVSKIGVRAIRRHIIGRCNARVSQAHSFAEPRLKRKGVLWG